MLVLPGCDQALTALGKGLAEISAACTRSRNRSLYSPVLSGGASRAPHANDRPVSASVRPRYTGLLIAGTLSLLLHTVAMFVVSRAPHGPLSEVALEVERPVLSARLIAPRIAPAAAPSLAQPALRREKPAQRVLTRPSNGERPASIAGSAAAGSAAQENRIDWAADLDSIGRHRYATAGASGANPGNAPAVRPKRAQEQFAREVAEAARPDCRQAYADMGLLALPALAIDSATQRGCKW